MIDGRQRPDLEPGGSLPVEVLVHQFENVIDALGRLGLEQLDLERALRGLDDDDGVGGGSDHRRSLPLKS
jgi:hypothetical protein